MREVPRSGVSLSRDDALALTSAVGTASQALAAWRGLMARKAFDEVSENAQRLMPAIYCNLRGCEAVPERERMRGAFKHAWAKNVRMLRDVMPTLTALSTSGIQYRLIKGVSVQLDGRGLGSRSMGDIDLLVAAADMRTTESILLSHGFRRNTHSGCDKHLSSAGDGAFNFNLGQTHVDLHAAERKYPAALLTRMLADPPRRRMFGTKEVTVPSVELLMLHAAVHGSQAVSATDFIQAACDIASLAPSSSSQSLLQLARETGTLDRLLSVDRALVAAGVASSGVQPSRVDYGAAVFRAGVGATSNMISKARLALRLVRERRLEPEAMDAIQSGLETSTWRYRAWLQSGRLSVVERVLFRTSGRFLVRPTSCWRSGHSARVFSESNVPGVAASPVAREAMDWRFRVRFDSAPKEIHVRVEAVNLDRVDAYAYVDGVPITRLVAGDEDSRRFSVVSPGRDCEISLRPSWAVCDECYAGFPDMLVRIDVVGATGGAMSSSR